MPVVVTQGPGGGTVLQNPVQQILQQLGQQPSQPKTTAAGATQVNTLSVQVSGNESLQVQKSAVPQQLESEEKTSPSAAVLQTASKHQEIVMGTEMSQEPSSLLETPQNADIQTAVPVSKSSEANCARVPAEMTPSRSSKERELPMNPDHPLDADDIIELIIMGNELDDSDLLQDEATLSFAEEVISGLFYF